MNHGQSVFAQLLSFVPFGHFEHLVDRFASNHGDGRRAKARRQAQAGGAMKVR